MTKILLKPTNRLLLGLIIAGTALTGVTAFYTISHFGQPQKTEIAPQPSPTIQKITALGRIEPRTEVVSLSAPMTLDSDRLAQLLVEEGEKVKAGQTIAILDSRDRLQDALRQAQQQVRVSQARLAQVKAGAKTGEIDAQQATVRRSQAQLQGEKAAQETTIQRLEAQLEGDLASQKAVILKLQAEYSNAKAEYERYRQLKTEGAISDSQFDAKQTTYETSSQQLEEAKITLNRIQRTGQQQINEERTNLAKINSTGVQQINEAQSTLNEVAEVRTVDVQVVQAEVDEAVAAVAKAQTELNEAYIRAPMNGQILNIHTRPGEQISDNGIVDMAQTDRMEVVAEIYQSDIGKIREGQKATITGESFSGELQGTVRLIGQLVNQQNVFSNEPGENLDRKIIEVRIRLSPQDSKKVSGLTNLQVQVAIEQGLERRG